ncbi:MAG: DUF2842 domain-containing protein [Pseudomonadota bacterium]
MRKLIAMVLFLSWLIIYIVGIATFSGMITVWPNWIQMIFYVIAGIAWVFPLKPLFLWMNTPSQES